MVFKYSYNTIVYTGEDYAIQSARVAKYGYDAIELVGEPDWYDTKEVNKINDGNGIKVSSICSIFMEGRDLVHSEKSEREKAIDYCKEIADMTAEVGGYTFIVAPSPVGKMQALASEEEEQKWAKIQEQIDMEQNRPERPNVPVESEDDFDIQPNTPIQQLSLIHI